MNRQSLDIETIKKENMLESIKDYRTGYIDQIHPMDDPSESDKVNVSKIDSAIKY